MSEWRPIETAPADSRPALVVKDYGDFQAVEIGLLDKWIRMNGYTYWMPLPEPPEDT
jgi:hypothetical protein